MSDESLFREVDEEVRQEQYKKLWSRYGNLIVGLCLLIIAGVAGFKGWQYWQVKQAEQAGTSFFTAVKLANDGKADDAAKNFKAIDQAGFATLAKLREANLLASTGKAADAVKIYDAVASDAAVETSLRDLAAIRAALALTDTAAPEELEKRLQAFNTATSPWRHTAREILAVAYWRIKDYASADKQVQAILGDNETPPGVLDRARMLSELITPLLAQK